MSGATKRYQRLAAPNHHPLIGGHAAMADGYFSPIGLTITRAKQRSREYSKLSWAIKSGKVIKPTICPQCGEVPEYGRIEGHHHDYSKPLEVKWLCSRCHTYERSSFMMEYDVPDAAREKAEREDIELRELVIRWLQQWTEGEK
jgi:hypothetical protein